MLYRRVDGQKGGILGTQEFAMLCRAAELFGFRFRGGRGSHGIYVRDGVRQMLNFQNVKGKAKPYQVKQFLKIVENYRLLEEEHV